MITQERVKELFDYNPDTGVFKRRVNVNGGGKAGTVIVRTISQPYARCRVDFDTYYVHRLIFLYMTGTFPDQVDHVDHNTDNNKWNNLRAVSQDENQINKKLDKRNKHGLPGVYKEYNKWRTYFCINKKQTVVYSGYDFFEACCARKSYEAKYGYFLNHGR